MTTDDKAFLDSFEKRSLPLSQWNQWAHVRIGYIYLRSMVARGRLRRCAVV